MPKQTFSILINNHNHADYLIECVESALTQTHPATEIIIVDDGSTDNSRQLLAQNYASTPRVRIIHQRNQGQISAIATAVSAAQNDILCFLDSDDTLHPDYLKEIAATYEANPHIDTLFCAVTPFGPNATDAANNAIVWPTPDTNYDYGYTSLLTCFGGKTWIGNLTSAISMKASLARMLDLRELAASWHFPLSGDYVLLLGASILGGRKYYLARPLVNYRLHETNAIWIADSNGQKNAYKRRMLQHIAHAHFRKKAGIRDSAYLLLDEEISTIPAPHPEHLRAYKRMKKRLRYHNGVLTSHTPLLRKLERRFRTWRKNLRSHPAK